MLLSGFNPNTETPEDADRTTNSEMGPKDFRNLNNVFQGARTDLPRTLRDLAEYAFARRMTIHSWTRIWTKWLETNAMTAAAPSTHATSGKYLPKQRQQELLIVVNRHDICRHS